LNAILEGRNRAERAEGAVEEAGRGDGKGVKLERVRERILMDFGKLFLGE